MKWTRVLFPLLFIPVLLWSQEKDRPVRDGFSFYDQGEYSKAADAFLEKALEQTDSEERSRSLYNAGCSLYQDYREQGNGESLERAVSVYYRVLQLDPSNREAAHNLEIARKELLNQNREQDNQINENQNREQSQETSEQSQKSSSPLADKQDSLAQRQDQTSQQHQKEQEELNQQTREAMENADDPDEKNRFSEALEKQQQAMEQMQKGNAEEARKRQEEAAASLKQLSPSGDMGDSAASMESAQQDATGPENPLDQELQQILNAEQRRNDKEAEGDANYNQVERNW